MASSGRSFGPNVLRSLPENAPHFFKIIKPFVLEEHKLRIPPEFVREFGHELSEVATLKVPGSRIWQVTLRREGKKIWICDGWRDFVGSLSISIEYFLVFRYDKKSEFHVLVFNPTCCEIGYLYDKNSRYLLANAPHFFKVVLPSDLAENRLGIPRKFFRQYGHKLSEAAIFTVPGSRVWRVGMKKEGEKIWFCDGWQDLVESLSISAGYFLIFRFENSSKFHVRIFNFTACEIEYPYDKGGSEFQDNMENEESTQIGEREFKFRSKKRKMKGEMEIGEPSSDNIPDLIALTKEMGIYVAEKRNYISAEETQRLINVARELKPEKPSFMIMWKSCHQACREVYVPALFAANFVKEDAKFVKVRTSDARAKSISIYRRTHGGFFLARGWAEFSKNLNLKEGDICMFELICENDILLKLSVHHGI